MRLEDEEKKKGEEQKLVSPARYPERITHSRKQASAKSVAIAKKAATRSGGDNGWNKRNAYALPTAPANMPSVFWA